jgi:hypothetical protein
MVTCCVSGSAVRSGNTPVGFLRRWHFGKAISSPRWRFGRGISSPRSLLFLPLASSLLFATGCAPNGTVQVSYRQVGGCNGWVDGHITHSAGPNAAFVVFQVTAIDNTMGTVPFALDSSKLYVNVGGHQHVDTSITGFLTASVGRPPLQPVTTAKGQSQTTSGYVLVVVPTVSTNGATEANATSYFLLYDTGSADPGVLLTKQDPTRTSWPATDDCRTLSF